MGTFSKILNKGAGHARPSTSPLCTRKRVAILCCGRHVWSLQGVTYCILFQRHLLRAVRRFFLLRPGQQRSPFAPDADRKLLAKWSGPVSAGDLIFQHGGLVPLGRPPADGSCSRPGGLALGDEGQDEIAAAASMPPSRYSAAMTASNASETTLGRLRPPPRSLPWPRRRYSPRGISVRTGTVHPRRRGWRAYGSTVSPRGGPTGGNR